ncbi:MAG: Holliday junction branch migration protein RuvA [Deltaproteobacteria bacterium]|nr:Holliday junction branch migration protein RuvA [Deltaproteobacteria bacterium]
MIASVSGRLDRSSPGEVVVDVGGVGYRLRVPLSTYAALPAPGAPVILRVVTVVREDEISLYGFATAEEEALFGLLQGVSGVGPKLALKILSGLSAEALGHALGAGDLRALTAVPGVGRKLAERLVLELRDKVTPVGTLPARRGVVRVEEDALEALVGLGYPAKTARQALEKTRSAGAASLEEIVREALRSLAPKR